MTQHAQDIGARIEVSSAMIAPDTTDAGTDLNGTAYRRSTNGLPLSCVLFASCGAAAGSPSAQSHKFVLQHSDDDGAGSPASWANYTDADGNEKTITLTADNAEGELDVDLRGAKDHVRLIYDASESSFTGGSSPTNEVAGGIVFGGFKELPQ